MPSARNTADVALMNLGNSRVYVQSEISPLVKFAYQGISSLGENEISKGDIEPIEIPSSEQYGVWDIVGEIQQSPSLPTMDLTARLRRDLTDVWFDLFENGCHFNIFTPMGKCQRPDNPDQWESFTLRTYTKITTLTMPVVNALEGGDNAVANLTGSMVYRKFIRGRALKFGEKADATILAEVLDGFYADQISCGDCGRISDGCRKYYWLTAANTGSPGLSSQLVVSTDDKATHFTIDLPLGGLSANRMALVGTQIVVVSQATGQHYYAEQSAVDAQTANAFTAVGGYVAGKAPRAIYSKNVAQTFVAGAAGYLYFLSDTLSTPEVLTDGTLTTEDFNDIQGVGRTVVAVGNNNALVYTTNDGDSVSSRTGPEVGANLTTVWCITSNIWLVGTNSGKVWATVDQGQNWTKILDLGAGSVINRIVFWDEAIGYLTAQVNGVAQIYSTLSVGAKWNRIDTSPRLRELPAAERFGALAVCGPNEVAVGGRVSPGGDGILSVAS